MKKPNVAVIGTVGLPANYGGFETLTAHLVDELNDHYHLTVYCSGKKYPKATRRKMYRGARLVYLPFHANGGQSIIYDFVSIIHAMFFADVLLVLGVSGAFALPIVRLLTRKKIVTSIDGIEWKRNKWSSGIRRFLRASEWMAVKFSHADIADNEAIQDYTATRYKTLSNIIEYGADHTLNVLPQAADVVKYPFMGARYFFKVCRIEPENNIHVVLHAFSRLPQSALVMVGNWQKSEYGAALKKEYAPFSNIWLLDPIYNQRELDLLRGNCAVYIHGHSAGGTNPSLVEAMYLGLPVITFDVAYNVATTEEKAIYFHTADDLMNIINTTGISRFKEVAVHMKTIADRRYTWKTIARKYEFLISKVFHATKKQPLSTLATQRLTQRELLHNELAHLQSPAYFFEKR